MAIYQHLKGFCFPIHCEESRDHWMASAFLFSSSKDNCYVKGSHYWDSLVGGPKQRERTLRHLHFVCSSIDELAAEGRRRNGVAPQPCQNTNGQSDSAMNTSPWNDSDFIIDASKGRRKIQENGFDCGVFAAKRLEHVAANISQKELKQVHMPFYREQIGTRILRVIANEEAEVLRGLPQFWIWLAAANGATYFNPCITGSECVAECLFKLAKVIPETCDGECNDAIAVLGKMLRDSDGSSDSKGPVSLRAAHEWLDNLGASAILLVLEVGCIAPRAIRLGWWQTGNPAQVHLTTVPLPVLVLSHNHLSVLTWAAQEATPVANTTQQAMAFVCQWSGFPHLWEKFDESKPDHRSWHANGSLSTGMWRDCHLSSVW